MKYLSIVLYVLMMSVGLVSTSHAAKNPIGYVVGGYGDLAIDNYGKCIKTGSWSKKHEIPECGGKIPDADGDGVADDKDKCPGTPKGVKVDSKGCPLDSDGDGVADYMDKCPGTPPGAAVDANGCPTDTDGDGIADYLDVCPNTQKGIKVDNNGCPLAVKIELRGVNFANNSAKLKSGSSDVLDGTASILTRYPDLKVEIGGHTDSSGAASYNKALSQKRAESVREYLISKGAKAGNLISRGYGESSPIADNKTRDGRAKNRRVEMKLLK